MNTYIHQTFIADEVVDLTGISVDLLRYLTRKIKAQDAAFSRAITPIGIVKGKNVFSYDQLIQFAVYKEFSAMRIGRKWSQFIRDIDHTADLKHFQQEGKVSITVDIKQIKSELNEKIKKMKG